jgi:hypothetical protein
VKVPLWKNCREEDVWKYVGWNLAKNGIETILVGGAVAAIYSEGAYKSGDLDLVLKTYVDGKITEVMASIGFYKKGGRHYIHPECDKFVEFMFAHQQTVLETAWLPIFTSKPGNALIKLRWWPINFHSITRRSKTGVRPRGVPRPTMS